MFLGRDYELNELNTLYAKDLFEMPVVYGRRRVGKSTLIREFIKDKKCIYYTAIEATFQRNLILFSQAIYRTLAPTMEGLPPFQSFEDAFTFIYKAACRERIVLVIDEYPYLAYADKSISSILQRYIDDYFSQSKLFLILCGSSMSFMEHQVLGYQSPLYGRRTAQFLISPFDYRTSALFVPSYTNEEKAIVYGVTGGIPKYLELFDDSISLRENIINLFLKESGYLYEEPSNLLKQELRDAVRYNSIIETIANGATKVSEISGKTHLDTAAISHYLDTLISLGIVSKEYAITEESNRKKSYYSIADTMFRFWYRFVQGGIDLIHSKNGDYLYDELIIHQLPDFMGSIFEQMCKQYLLQQNAQNALPFKLLKFGRWWGNNPALKREEEIDIVGINPLKKQAVFAECKFRNQLAGPEIFENLRNKAALIKGFEETYYILFSKSGFSDTLMEQVPENTLLISLDDMYMSGTQLIRDIADIFAVADTKHTKPV